MLTAISMSAIATNGVVPGKMFPNLFQICPEIIEYIAWGKPVLREPSNQIWNLCTCHKINWKK